MIYFDLVNENGFIVINVFFYLFNVIVELVVI